MKRYLVVVEQTETGYSAFSPDVPGCASTGPTVDAVKASMREALELHIEGLRIEGYPVPEPSSESAYVTIAA